MKKLLFLMLVLAGLNFVSCESETLEHNETQTSEVDPSHGGGDDPCDDEEENCD